MAAAYASLVSLMNLVHDLEHHPPPSISLDKQLLESITQHITFFEEYFLHDFNSPPPHVADDPLEMRIAAAAYAVEDAIESHIVDTIQHPGTKSIKLCRDSLQSVIEDMDSIKKAVVVKVETEKKERKKEALVVLDQVEAMTNVHAASVARNETMAESNAVMLKIMEKLTGGRPHFQAIPVVGMGGIGKTFLATSIYAHPLIKECFDICAWATISQHYNTKEILCELLSDQATNAEKSEEVLGSELHKRLFGRRFLIVMDDMWSIDAWDKIQRFFPNNDNGSRVLVTTRLSQLSSQLNNDYSLHMSFLDEASSWDLFSKTVFGEKIFPSELKKIGAEIVDSCRGLPLSIVVVGGLLKKMDGTLGSWESIRDNLSSAVNMDNDKHCLRLLKLSYIHLPVYLKPCFLYMGVFEEDGEIHVSMLIKLWISEELLKPTYNGETLETTARGFLQDLFDRNLILIDKSGSTGSIKSCKIHDLVRDMCLKEGQKNGFYHVIGQHNPVPQGMNAPRRVVIPKDTSKKKVRGDLRSISHARSIICEHGMVPPAAYRKFGLLRTLHAYKLHIFCDESYLNSLPFGYVNLRHLAIVSRDISSFLPSVSLIWNLHTFIVSCIGKTSSHLFSDFWKIPQFRHIQFVSNWACLPDPPISCDGDAVVIMEHLHTLKGVRNLKCSEGVIKRIPNIKKLKLHYDNGDNDDEDYLVANIKHLRRLESLSITIRKPIGFTTYDNKLAFPHSLKKLILQTEYEWDDGMLEKIGSLPLLEKLKLSRGRFGKGKWEAVEGLFPCLKYLQLSSCYYLKKWTAAEEGSNIFPRLEHVRLLFMKELKEIPCELGNIDTLKIIELYYCGEGAVKCAKEMVDEQLESQGQLCFHVEVIIREENQQHLLSLAGPNFQIIIKNVDANASRIGQAVVLDPPNLHENPLECGGVFPHAQRTMLVFPSYLYRRNQSAFNLNLHLSCRKGKRSCRVCLKREEVANIQIRQLKLCDNQTERPLDGPEKKGFLPRSQLAMLKTER